MLPWILSSAAKDGYMEVRKPKVILFVNERVEKMHNSWEDKYGYYDFSFLQRDTVNLPDYDTIQDSDSDQRDHGKVCFYR